MRRPLLSSCHVWTKALLAFSTPTYHASIQESARLHHIIPDDLYPRLDIDYAVLCCCACWVVNGKLESTAGLARDSHFQMLQPREAWGAMLRASALVVNLC